MKILKILLIILVPAIGIVGCKKSDMKPGCPANAATATVPKAEINNNTASEPAEHEVYQNSARMAGVMTEEDGNTSLVGSGDDDRDGGDKKRKK